MKIKKYFKIKMGFTLIEVLVVIAVIGVIGYSISEVLSRSMKGATKTQFVDNIKQNGQVALDMVSKEVRSSALVVCVSSSKDVIGLQLEYPNSAYSTVYTRFYFKDIGNPPSMSGPGGQLIQDYPQNLPTAMVGPKLCDFSQVAVNLPHSLTDGTQMYINQGSFDLHRTATPNDTVSIDFILKPTDKTGFENQLGGSGEMEFTTTAQVR